jgi:streptogramin lyase
VLGGYSSTVTVPAASNAATLTLTLGATQPAGTPAVQTVKRRTQAIGGTGVTPVAFLTVQSTVAVTLGATTVFSFTLPAGAPALGQISGIALYDPTASPQSGWTTFDGPGTVSGNTLAFSGSSALQLNAGVTYDVVLFTTVSALPTPTPTPVATPSPTPTPSASEGVITEFPSSTVGRYPYGITRGPDGNLWYTEPRTNDFGNRGVGRITPAGVVTEFSTVNNVFTSAPADITTGPDGNLWFTESDSDRISRITPGGSITSFAGLTFSAGPAFITKGPDGNLWFTEPGIGKIGRISTAGAVTEFTTGYAGAITGGADGNVWFSDSSDGRIGRITPAGVVTYFSNGISAQYAPHGIAAGSDGNVWFVEGIPFGSNDKIGRITPAGVITEFSSGVTDHLLAGMTLGPDGNMWFTGINAIGRITPAGVVTEFPEIHGNPAGPITAGPDGNLWFTEEVGSSNPPTIARIVP